MNRSLDPVINLLKDVPRDSTLDDILQELLAEFGGPKGYARMVRSVFDNAQEGGVTQQKILDLMGTLMSRKATIDKNVTTDYTNLSNEELDNFFEAHLQDALNDPTRPTSPEHEPSSGAEQEV